MLLILLRVITEYYQLITYKQHYTVITATQHTWFLLSMALLVNYTVPHGCTIIP